MTSTDGRVAAAVSVLRGASVTTVAQERGVSPEVVLEWVDLFCEGGEALLGKGMHAETPKGDRFLTLIAHQFRTPLAIIAGWVDMMTVAGPLSEGVHAEALTSIRRQVAHLERVARDALDAGAVARGQLRLIVAPVKLRDLIAGVLSAIHDPLLSLKPGEEVAIVADGSRLEQVVGGVLEHARRLAEDVPVTVDIDTSQADQVTVRTWVDGRELAIGEAAVLLEPYASTDTSFGRGLGLYLCRALLVAHGGEIGLRTEGGCTLFWFSVPRQGPEVSRLVQHN
jgi:signal transduction histidine kinase